MRIELNAGGLGGAATISGFRSDFSSLISNSKKVISNFSDIKKSTYNVNGGVGNLQSALDDIEARIAVEEENQDNLVKTEEKINDFIQLAKRIDDKVADLVTKNKEEFYRVNSWARPAPSINPIDDIIRNIYNWGKWFLGPVSVLPLVFGELVEEFFCSNSETNEKGLNVIIRGSGPSGSAEDGKASGSLLSGSVEVDGFLNGLETKGTIQGELVGGSAKNTSGAVWNIGGKKASVMFGGVAEGYLAKGSVSGSIGLLRERATGSVGNVYAKGNVGLSVFKDGVFSPSVGINVLAGVNVAQGSIEKSFGSDEYNIHSKASGSVIGASASADAQLGVITYKDSEDEVKTAFGASAEVGAEAYLAEGKVSEGMTIFGIKFDVEVSGKFGGAGAKAGGRVTADGVAGEVDLGLGAGAGLKFNVDWSGFKNPFEDFKVADILPWNWF